MKQGDQYHKWVEWSDEDQTYIGKCPDLITGIHGDDPTRVYAELCEVIEDVITHFKSEGRALPDPKVKPMQENHSRAEFFVSLGELCDIIPDMRAGQILAAIGELCADLHGRGLWEAADAELVETVWQFRRNFEAANVPPE